MSPTPATPLLSMRADTVLPWLVLILTMAILSSFADLGITVLASGAAGVQYRFQVVGLFFAALPQLTILLALMMWLTMMSARRTELRGASIAAMLIGVAALLLLPVFGLDLLESRRSVSQANVKGFTLAALKTAGFAACLGALGIWAGWKGIQASSKPRGDESRAKGEGLVVGQE